MLRIRACRPLHESRPRVLRCVNISAQGPWHSANRGVPWRKRARMRPRWRWKGPAWQWSPCSRIRPPSSALSVRQRAPALEFSRYDPHTAPCPRPRAEGDVCDAALTRSASRVLRALDTHAPAADIVRGACDGQYEAFGEVRRRTMLRCVASGPHTVSACSTTPFSYSSRATYSARFTGPCAKAWSRALPRMPRHCLARR